jgi:hypothetical protein
MATCERRNHWSIAQSRPSRAAAGDPAELHSAPTGTRSITTLARGGLVLKNLSQDVALKVDIVTKWRETAKSPSLADDEFSPQRFALIPPGTYYIQQRPSASRGNDETAWSAPIPLDDSSGRLVVDLRDPGDGESREVTLLPLTFVPEDKRVAFLRFWVAGREWHRDADGALIEEHGTNQWDAKLDQSETKVLTAGSTGRGLDPSVIAVVQRLFRYFTDDNWKDGGSPTRSEAEPRLTFRQDFASVKMTTRYKNDDPLTESQSLRLKIVADPAYAVSIQGSGGTSAKVGFTVEILRGAGSISKGGIGGSSLERDPSLLSSDKQLEDYAQELLTAIRTKLAEAGEWNV